jgi:hypothetical protein
LAQTILFNPRAFHELPRNLNCLGIVRYMKDQPWFAWFKFGISSSITRVQPLECEEEDTTNPIIACEKKAVVRSGSWSILKSKLSYCHAASESFMVMVPRRFRVDIPQPTKRGKFCPRWSWKSKKSSVVPVQEDGNHVGWNCESEFARPSQEKRQKKKHGRSRQSGLV